MGRKYAQRMVRGIEGAEAKIVVTDCALSGQRIEKETGKKPLHPVSALAEAYGIAVDLGS
jgi:glycerol-3-phosphate dehydrogenase subunit C